MISPFDEDDWEHLHAAHGYVELGMWLDANEELEKLRPDVRHDSLVLAILMVIYKATEKWELMQTVAKKLTEYDPESPRFPLAWAFATRRVDSLDAARRILVEAWKVHEKEPLFPFTIACYMCQLGQVESAKEMLEVAFKMDRGMRRMALEDEDLKPLWHLI
jgi:hypothetical protein